ncbi:lipopolysaccharide biosynthesis protein [Frondihabitans australicus]|uniref:O-antigen/teichoic acid export membrane protein n=1 Tax=Frondihabitans australicus TaxID=386892 RepID=A0A495IK72_9MICO|nr:hypothetical protein [Frondihabitans australicus]RKR76130.1 O-antigen/teichoic acid export membrane protein [Frondihabitans australicus]
MNRRLTPVFLMAASASRYAAQLGVLVIVVRVFGSGAAGEYALALAVTAPGFIVLDLGLRDVRLTLHRPIPASRYLALRAAASGTVLLVTVVIAVAVAPATAGIVAAVSLQKVVDAFTDLRSGFLQADRRAGLIPALTAGTAACQLAAVGVSTLVHATLVQTLLASATMSAVVLVALGLVLRSPGTRDNARPASSRLADWRTLLRAGLPTGLASGLVTLLTAIPQYVLAAHASPTDLSVLSVHLYLIVALQVVASALAQSWLPRARGLALEGRLTVRDAAHAGLTWARITTPLALGAVVAGALLLPLVFTPDYALSLADAAAILLAAIALPLNLAGANALSSLNRYSSSLLVSALTTLAALALALAIVPWAGHTGALWAYVLTIPVRASLSALILVRVNAARVSRAAA